MDGVRRARTRGPRRGRGRGVRTRGGLGDGNVRVVQEVVVVEGDGRGRRGRGRRGGRAVSSGRLQTGVANKRPSAIDEINIVNIGDLPLGEPLAHRLGPKRSRTWRPSPATAAVPSPLSNPNSPPLMDCVVEVECVDECESSPRPFLENLSTDVSVVGSPAIPPSPAMFVELGGSTSSSPSRMPVQSCPPRQPLRDEQILWEINYGSEPDTDDSDDDEVVAPTIVPRVFQSLLDTPQDDDATTAPGSVAGSSSDATDSHLLALIPDDQTYLPNNFYNFHWTSFPDPAIPPESRRESFSNINIGPTTPCVDPYETFIAIWDPEFMEHIASETNRYAQLIARQMLENHTLYPTSRICDWRDTSVDELYVYIAILLAMGIMVKSRIDEYWSANSDIFYTPGFSAHMSLRRFQLLSRCLHFNNNEDMCAQELNASEAKLFKIQPVLLHLNNKFQAMYKMDRNIALDESLLMWKGWLDINQFIPNKAAAVGIKTYEVCESQTGYLWRFEVHAHKRTNPSHQSDPLDASTPAIVLRLIKGLEYKGHTLWMDNFYNSPALARRLKTLGFDCVGTLRTNRQFVPDDLTNLTKANMRPGQITGFTSGDVDLMVWRDKNRVAMISTYHGNAIAVVNEIPKPIIILDYNVMMGGVDKKDQLLAMYPIERKRAKIWYKKLFRRLLNVSVLNSYILVKRTSSSSSSLSHRAFRISLIKSILQKHSSPVVVPIISQDRIFEAKKHYLAEYPFLPGHSGRQRRICCKCKKRVHTFCAGCNNPVCMTSCFVSLHS